MEKNNENKVPGGKGDNIDVTTLYKDELAVGIEVEMEHTSDKEVAMEIAMDHLEEVPDYYSRLIKSGLVDEEPALKKYKELFNDDPSKYLNEIANQLNPSNVNGMGEVTLPESPGGTTDFSSQETGSGDNSIPKKEKKKKRKKMLYISNYDNFSGNKNS